MNLKHLAIIVLTGFLSILFIAPVLAEDMNGNLDNNQNALSDQSMSDGVTNSDSMGESSTDSPSNSDPSRDSSSDNSDQITRDTPSGEADY